VGEQMLPPRKIHSSGNIKRLAYVGEWTGHRVHVYAIGSGWPNGFHVHHVESVDWTRVLEPAISRDIEAFAIRSLTQLSSPYLWSSLSKSNKRYHRSNIDQQHYDYYLEDFTHALFPP
jgi:hypothetical protein